MNILYTKFGGIRKDLKKKFYKIFKKKSKKNKNKNKKRKNKKKTLLRSKKK